MKNRDWVRYPTAEELYALERAARAARAHEMARLTRAALVALRELFAAPKGVRHA
jgi:hypothetical protein